MECTTIGIEVMLKQISQALQIPMITYLFHKSLLLTHSHHMQKLKATDSSSKVCTSYIIDEDKYWYTLMPWSSHYRCKMTIYFTTTIPHLRIESQLHEDVIKWKHFRVTGHCAGNSPVTGEFPYQRPVTRSFDVFFDLRLNKQRSKQSWGW